MRPRRSTLCFVVLAASVLCAACGSNGGSEAGAPAEKATPPVNTDVKPTVAIPDGQPPDELVIRDIKVGSGAEAVAGTTVRVHYVGVAWSTKQQFDASWDRGKPLDFPLGQGMVIPGWEQGVEGMKVGGRRELIIPPDLAYGPSGQPPVIGPNETLVFVIDLLEVA